MSGAICPVSFNTTVVIEAVYHFNAVSCMFKCRADIKESERFYPEVKCRKIMDPGINK